MKHIDLFSGIGGFAYALDQVFYEEKNEHIFSDNDPFCQAVLRKHWPEAEIYGDIRELTADTEGGRGRGSKSTGNKNGQSKIQTRNSNRNVDILTGGFPCQPFSQAGRRKGTEDDRYLWPEMFRVIQDFKPEWVIAENVRGLVTWNEGLVLQQVCTDLESEGYEVQPLIIPAVAVNAPHRRDRVWIIAHYKSVGSRGGVVKNVELQNGSYSRKNQDGVRHGVRVQDVVAMLPTPDVSDRRSNKSKQKGVSNVVGTKTGLKLQPAFALWMMGFPTDWCDLETISKAERGGETKPLKRQATQSSRK